MPARALRLALWVGLAVASGYSLAVVLAIWAHEPADVPRALAAGSYVDLAPGVFLLRMVPPLVLALVLGALALGGEALALGSFSRTALRRLATVHLPLLLSPLVLAQDDLARRPVLLAAALASSVALAVHLRRTDPDPDPDIDPLSAPVVSIPLPGRSPPRPWREHLPMLGVLAVHAVAFTWLTVQRDRALWSATVDLGIFKEALWHTLHGRVMYSPTVGYSFLGEHFAPVLFLLVPLYALWPTSACLLTVQALAITAAGWPLYLLARDLGLGRRLSTALSGAMLFAPAMQGALLYDFHMDLLGVPALAWLVLAVHRHRWGQAAVATALLVSTKEDMFIPALAVLLGCALAGDRRDRVRAAALGAVTLAYCGLAMAVLLPRFGPPHGVPVYMAEAGAEGYKFLRNYHHLRGPGGPLRFLLGEPVRYGLYALTDARLTTLLTLALPLALVPALARKRLPLVLPLAIVLLSDNPEVVALRYHYGAIQHPGLYAAAAYGAASLVAASPRPGRLRESLAAFVVTAALAMGALHPASVASVVHATDTRAVTPHVAAVDRLVAMIPPAAPVTATTFLGPRLSNRPWIGLFPNSLDRADWALVDLQRPPWPAQPDQRDELLRAMMRAQWGAVAWEDGAVLLHKQPDHGRNAEAVRDLFARRRYEVEGTEQTEFPGCAVRDPTASGGWARVVRPTDPRSPGYLVFGPFLRLPAGEYTVTFRLRAEATAFRGDIGVADVHARPDNTLATVDLTPEQFPDGSWHDVTLAFTVDHEDGIEFRVRTARRWTLGADVISLHAVNEVAMVRTLMGPR